MDELKAPDKPRESRGAKHSPVLRGQSRARAFRNVRWMEARMPVRLLTGSGSAIWGLQQGGVVLGQDGCFTGEGAATDGVQPLVVGVFVEDHAGQSGEALQLGGQAVNWVMVGGDNHGLIRSPSSSNICPMDI